MEDKYYKEASEKIKNNTIDIKIDEKLVQEHEVIVGTGGFSNVYRGTMDGRIVAIKKFKYTKNNENDRSTIGPKKAVILIDETAKLSKLWNRGGIVSILGVILKPGKYIKIVMEYVDGGTLNSFVKEKGTLIGLEGKRILLYKVANAIQLCHDSDIIHGDIKEDNILMDHQLNPKICDFGASIIEEYNPNVGGDNKEYHGTKDYLAPERKQKNEGRPHKICKPTKESDIYSFGVMCNKILEEDKRKCFEELIENCTEFESCKRCNISEIVENLSKEKHSSLSSEHIERVKKDLRYKMFNSTNIDKARDMLTILANDDHQEAILWLGYFELVSKNVSNAEKWLVDRCSTKTLKTSTETIPSIINECVLNNKSYKIAKKFINMLEPSVPVEDYNFSPNIINIAFANRDYKLMDLFVKKIPHLLNVKDSSGKLPIHQISYWTNIDKEDYPTNNFCHTIIKPFKSLIDSMDNDGKTPLFYAFANNLQHMVIKLIECGANLFTGIEIEFKDEYKFNNLISKHFFPKVKKIPLVNYYYLENNMIVKKFSTNINIKQIAELEFLNNDLKKLLYSY